MARRDDWRQQAKDSLSVRNVQPAIKTFRGDPKLAAGYLPLANVLLGSVINQSNLGGIGYNSRLVKLADGTVIKVICNSGIYCIDINASSGLPEEAIILMSIYMESGFIDARSFAGEFQPKNTIYETTLTNSVDKFKDTLIIDEPLEFKLSTNRSHAMPGGIDDKRSLKWLPLMSTGLLRRAIQSLIGRANPTYAVPSDEEDDDYGEQSSINIKTKAVAYDMAYGVNGGPSGIFSVDMVILTHTAGTSRGLFRSSDYEYFFISIQTPNVYAYPCKFRAVGTLLIEYMKSETREPLTDEEIIRLESYILSDIYIDKENRFLVGTIAISGSTIFNGWHFNNSGSKADIITLERIFSTDEIPKDRYMIARHYCITFSLNEDFDVDSDIGDSNAPLAMSLAKIEETNCTPRNNIDNVWVPLYALSNMTYYYWCTNNAGFLDEMTSYDAPVYCMYDTDDNLLVTRVYLNPETIPIVGTELAFYGSVYTCSGTTEDTEYFLSSYKHSGFYIENSSDYRLYDKVGDRRYAKATIELTSDVVTQTYGGADPYNRAIVSNLCGNRPDIWWAGTGAYTTTKTGAKAWGERYSSSVFTETNNYLFIIPWFDAESFYCGNTVQSMETGTKFYYYEQGIGTEYVLFTSGPSMGMDAFYTSPGPSNANISQGGGLPVDAEESNAIVSRQIFNTNLVLHYKTNSIGVDEVNYEEADYDINKLLTAMGRWSALIDPILFGPFAYPFFDIPFAVIQGCNDNLVYFYDVNCISWDEGFTQRNVVDMSEDQVKDIYIHGTFSGWA